MGVAGNTPRRQYRRIASAAAQSEQDQLGPKSVPRRAQARRSDDLAPGPFSDPNSDDISHELGKTLASPEFRSAPQLQAFLNFVVQAALDNRNDEIKGYTIAIEALGRDTSFNPVTDPIVRVEAARLRRRLEKYYKETGKDDKVRISIPKGGYAPAFRYAETAEARNIAQQPTTCEVQEQTGGTRSPGEVSVADAAGTDQRTSSTPRQPPARAMAALIHVTAAHSAHHLGRALVTPIPFYKAAALGLTLFALGYLLG